MLLLLGARLRKLRDDKELTQKQLAEMLKVKKATVSSYEKDKTLPSLEVFRKICDIFQVSADYLLELNENPQRDRTELTDNQVSILDNLMEEFRRTNKTK